MNTRPARFAIFRGLLHTALFAYPLLASAVSQPPPAGVSFTADKAQLSAPLIVRDGCLVLPDGSAQGTGRAEFKVTIESEGDYQLSGFVKATAGSRNSFLLNMDGDPVSPGMIWDMPLDKDFAEVPVSWRGSWENQNPEYCPKVFHLTKGEHTLVLVGREPETLVQRLTLIPWAPARPGSPEDFQRRQDLLFRSSRHRAESLPAPVSGDERVDFYHKELSAARADLFMEAVSLAGNNPGSDESFLLLNWVLGNGRSHYLPAGPKAFRLLADHHAADPRLLELMTALSKYSPYEGQPSFDEVSRLLAKVETSNKDPNVLACCALTRAEALFRTYERFEYLGDRDKAVAAAGPAAAAYEKLIADFGDCRDFKALKDPSAPSFRQRGESQLANLRVNRIGEMALPIDAADTEGVPMRLSDFKGKAVMLVFWASWCGPCMHAVPHEKELFARFSGRPFALVGVNGDSTRAAASKVVAQHQIPWRSFWSDKNAISEAWHIRGWPTVILIDHEGRIARKLIAGPDIDIAMEQLVSAAERSQAKIP